MESTREFEKKNLFLEISFFSIIFNKLENKLAVVQLLNANVHKF